MSDSEQLTISPLFGEIAVDLGLVDSGHLLDALGEQAERKRLGEPVPRIGRLLVERGQLSEEGLEQVLLEVERRTWGIQVPGYHSLEHMSGGGTTLLFRAVERGTGAPVGIRFLRFSLADRPDEIRHFEEAVSRLSRLDHPNVLRVLGSGDLEGFPYLLEEQVQAADLRTRLSGRGPLPPYSALKVARGIAAGLAHAHRAGVVHGNLRPGAVYLTRLAGPKLSDFSVFDPPQEIRRASPHYLSPLQALGGAATPLDDLYSLGAVLYRMLTGRPPFEGKRSRILSGIVKETPPDPVRLVPDLPEPVAALVRDLQAKFPEDRPSDAAEVLERMNSLLGSFRRSEACRPVEKEA